MSSSSPDATGRRPDRIVIPRIRARCVLGARPRERLRPRPVEVSVTVEADLEAAAAADALELTVDYSRLARVVRERVAGSAFGLVEALARHVAAGVLALPGVLAVEVTVAKPGAVRGAGAPQVQMRRERQ